MLSDKRWKHALEHREVLQHLCVEGTILTHKYFALQAVTSDSSHPRPKAGGGGRLRAGAGTAQLRARRKKQRETPTQSAHMAARKAHRRSRKQVNVDSETDPELEEMLEKLTPEQLEEYYEELAVMKEEEKLKQKKKLDLDAEEEKQLHGAMKTSLVAMGAAVGMTGVLATALQSPWAVDRAVEIFGYGICSVCNLATVYSAANKHRELADKRGEAVRKVQSFAFRPGQVGIDPLQMVQQANKGGKLEEKKDDHQSILKLYRHQLEAAEDEKASAWRNLLLAQSFSNLDTNGKQKSAVATMELLSMALEASGSAVEEDDRQVAKNNPIRLVASAFETLQKMQTLLALLGGGDEYRMADLPMLAKLVKAQLELQQSDTEVSRTVNFANHSSAVLFKLPTFTTVQKITAEQELKSHEISHREKQLRAREAEIQKELDLSKDYLEKMTQKAQEETRAQLEKESLAFQKAGTAQEIFKDYFETKKRILAILENIAHARGQLERLDDTLRTVHLQGSAETVIGFTSQKYTTALKDITKIREDVTTAATFIKDQIGPKIQNLEKWRPIVLDQLEEWAKAISENQPHKFDNNFEQHSQQADELKNLKQDIITQNPLWLQAWSKVKVGLESAVDAEVTQLTIKRLQARRNLEIAAAKSEMEYKKKQDELLKNADYEKEQRLHSWHVFLDSLGADSRKYIAELEKYGKLKGMKISYNPTLQHCEATPPRTRQQYGQPEPTYLSLPPPKYFSERFPEIPLPETFQGYSVSGLLNSLYKKQANSSEDAVDDLGDLLSSLII
jgi:hypothetical protein